MTIRQMNHHTIMIYESYKILNELYFQLAGMIGPIELPFDGCPSNACASMASGDCPTEVGENLVYELDFEVRLLSLFNHILASSC